MIRIIYDARSVVSKASGIGNYALSLLRHMVEQSPDFTFTVLRHVENPTPLLEHPRVREVQLIPGETKSVATLLRSNRIVELAGHDLYHSPADMVPPRVPCPFVVTLHDMMWIEAPHLASAFLPVRIPMHWWYRGHITYSVRRSRAVIAISQATADATARLFPQHAHKLHVVHHGLDRSAFDTDRVPERGILQGWAPLDTPFALAVGQGSPYKNHANIVRAYLEATRDLPGHRLVLVRRFARVDHEMQRLLSQPDVKRRVIVHSFVPGELLLALYRYADALLFASHYEGCGMPSMEAMALGTPVLLSHAPALVEMAGDAGLKADSRSVPDMAAKMRQLFTDSSLRQELSRVGMQRVRGFTWEDCARKTLDVYRVALGGECR